MIDKHYQVTTFTTYFLNLRGSFYIVEMGHTLKMGAKFASNLPYSDLSLMSAELFLTLSISVEGGLLS